MMFFMILDDCLVIFCCVFDDFLDLLPRSFHLGFQTATAATSAVRCATKKYARTIIGCDRLQADAVAASAVSLATDLQSPH